jgi:hypothetical protein
MVAERGDLETTRSASPVTRDADSLARAERWVRTACWIGAITDAGAAVQMLVPQVFAFAYRPSDFHPGTEYRFAMGMGASLMIGWTALLVWAAQRPIERRGVLLLTVVPVVVGLVINEIVGIAQGFMPVGPLVPVLLLQLALSALFLASYSMAADQKPRLERPPRDDEAFPFSRRGAHRRGGRVLVGTARRR